MKGLSSITLAVASLLLCVHTSARAVQSDKAIAGYDARGNMISLYNLTTQEARETCSRFVYVGAVTRAEYDNQRQLVTFSIRRKSRRVESFNTVNARFGEIDSRKVPTLLKVGNRVSVVAYGCGASAAVLEADDVKKLD